MADAALDERFDESGYERIRTWLNDRCGIYYAEKKKELLSQRLARVLERFDLSSLDELADCVETGQKGDIELAVVDVASTNHTYFFREPRFLTISPTPSCRSWRTSPSCTSGALRRRLATKPIRWRSWRLKLLAPNKPQAASPSWAPISALQ